MDDNVYRVYCEGKNLVKLVESCPNEYGEAELSLASDIKLSNVIIEEKLPEYLHRYNKEQEMLWNKV